MKSYRIFMDITISKAICVDAENEEDAMKIAEKRVDKEPYYYAGNADSYVSSEITDIYEEE